MPIHKARNNYIKVYRPNGMRFSNGLTLKTPEEAIRSAEDIFFQEFRDIPPPHHRIYEIIGVTGGYGATLHEIIEPEELDSVKKKM